MNWSLRFSDPEALALLALVPWAIWVGWKIGSLSGARKWTIVTLRALILVLLIMALAGAEALKKTDVLAVFFLIDRSNSIPLEKRETIPQVVRDYAANRMKSKDEAGVIAFGDDSSIELAVGPTLDLGDIKSKVGGDQTDLAAAIRLATAAFPQSRMKRIVILSDGNETRGSAIEEAKSAKAAGVTIDVFPVEYELTNEVRVVEVAAPNRTRTDEPFQLRVVVHSTRDTEAVIRLFRKDDDGRNMIGEQKVALLKGDNAFLLSQELYRNGMVEYEAEVEAQADGVVENNSGRAFTFVRGEPKILLVDGDAGRSATLGDALKTSGLEVITIAPGAIPGSMEEFQSYDAIILANVSAADIPAPTHKVIEALVRDMGVGLVMTGGPNAFGAGGYFGSPIEKALPVDMDVKQRKVLPRGALVLIMHTCEIPDGNMWAREIGLASLETLASQDLMGALGYMWGGQGQNGDSWIYELQPVGEKVEMRRMLTAAATQIGDMPSVGPTIQMAYDALVKADAAVKRVILISDGDPAAPNPALLTQMAKAGIAVSTVCIAPHSPSDQSMLQNIANVTGGQYYFVTDPNNLPRIFSKEAAVVKKGMMIEREFTPAIGNYSEILAGVLDGGIPSLGGYVVTTAKDSATVALVSDEADPVLAHWRYGVGKAVAFTSDVTTRWASRWLDWSRFGMFWTKTVRWVMREKSADDFRIETRTVGGVAYVKVDAANDQGSFRSDLRPTGVVTGPAPAFERRRIDLMQTSPGIYEGSFPADSPGVYMIALAPTPDSGVTSTTAVAVNYSREYEFTKSNRAMLEAVAKVAGGRVLSTTDNPFEHNMETSRAIHPIWRQLALIALLLFPIEIFLRRVVFSAAGVYALVATAAQRVPGLGRIVKPPATAIEVATGHYRAATVEDKAVAATKPSSFGVVTERPPEPVAPKDKKSKKKGATGGGEYTRQLLAAKKKTRKTDDNNK